MYFCCLLCCLVKAGPGLWSESNWLFAQQFILNWALWANSVPLWMHTAITVCLSSTEWVGRFAGRHPWHRRHPKQARKTPTLMPTLSWNIHLLFNEFIVSVKLSVTRVSIWNPNKFRLRGNYCLKTVRWSSEWSLQAAEAMLISRDDAKWREVPESAVGFS